MEQDGADSTVHTGWHAVDSGSLHGTRNTEIYSDWFRRLIYSLHHDYNESAAETLGVISDRAGFTAGDPAPDWTWQNEPSAITLVWHGAHPLSRNPPGKEAPPEEHDLVIRTAVQGFSFRRHMDSVGIATGVMLVVGGLFWALAQKLFLFHIAPAETERAAPARGIPSRGTQCPDSAAAGLRIGSGRSPPGSWTWRSLATGPRWAELVDLDSVPHQTLIEVQHFEYTTGDPEIDNQKLLLLERLIHRNGHSGCGRHDGESVAGGLPAPISGSRCDRSP